MGYVQPTIVDFQQYFSRDFPYGTTPNTVMDSDILKAQNQANANFNEGLFPNQGVYFIGFNLLTAHYLVMNLRQSSQGTSGQFTWNANSHSVGSVSESLSIPQRILDNPEFSFFTKTNYGTEYLMMVLPYLSGQMFAICGRTNP